MATRTLKKKEIDYPSSDGKPMAETDAHRDWMFENIMRLQRFFAGRKVYVSGNLLIYYVEGDWHKSLAPDTFVVKNCKPRKRTVFLTWKERRKPNFVLETTSKTTRREDSGKKKEKYAQIGVKEYFLYDPFGEWLKPPLQGYSLVHGVYERITPDAEGGVTSKELGIRFILEDGNLAMFDAATGARLLTNAEHIDATAQQVDEEKLRADGAMQHANEEAKRADEEKHRADEEKQRADEEKQRADQAEQRARAAEEELARLKGAAAKTNGHNRKNGK